MAQLKSGSTVGGSNILLDVSDSVDASNIAANAVNASELNVSGNGTTSQFLRSDGDGTFTWAAPTNTTYTAGTGLGLSGTTFSHTDTSSQASVNNSGNTVIQDITLDTYGHITGLTSATITAGGAAATIRGYDVNHSQSGNGWTAVSNYYGTITPSSSSSTIVGIFTCKWSPAGRCMTEIRASGGATATPMTWGTRAGAAPYTFSFVHTGHNTTSAITYQFWVRNEDSSTITVGHTSYTGYTAHVSLWEIL